jgi:hypothetical protein
VVQQQLLQTQKNMTEQAWTAGGNLNTARFFLAGAGTQTAGLAFGGETQQYFTAATEEYDGIAWTNSTAMATARRRLAGAGTTNCRAWIWWLYKQLILMPQKNTQVSFPTPTASTLTTS